MSQLERIYAFHQKLKNNSYPNARSLAEEFELSKATAHRDINYLRDRLLAPLAFNGAENGYYYTDTAFRLPFEDSPKLLFIMGLLNKMAEEAGLDHLPEMQKLERRLNQLLPPVYGRVMDNIIYQWIEVENVAPAVFESIVETVLQDKLLVFTYTSAMSHVSERTVEPLRMINYQGRWYLLAYCLLRCSHRMFHMARMQEVAIGAKRTGNAHPVPQSYLNDTFGIFAGKPKYQAVILFSGTAAEMVRRQHWHSKQKLETHKEGVILSLPVADDREIIMKILQYGHLARVLEPPELKRRIADEAIRIQAHYL